MVGFESCSKRREYSFNNGKNESWCAQLSWSEASGKISLKETLTELVFRIRDPREDHSKTYM